LLIYLDTGVVGTPGFLSQGGLIGGGLAIIRPDLHFLYNLLETVPLAIAFFWQVRHTDAVRAVTPSSGQPLDSLASAATRP
jgi:hypothetical protein